MSNTVGARAPVDAPVAGYGADEVLPVGGFHELVHETGGEGTAILDRLTFNGTIIEKSAPTPTS